LNTEDRDKKMMDRLREIYASQGIEVPDHVLEEGVKALEEDRFVYTPPESGLDTWLAKVYVSRGKWGKPLLIAAGILVVVWMAYILLIRGPAEREIAELPGQLESHYETLLEHAAGPIAKERADSLLTRGKSALQKDDTDAVRAVVEQMEALQHEIEREYELKIVSRPGEKSGVWRVPEANPEARNYYIIVEAVTEDGRVLELPVVNEEDGKTYQVSKWGMRVDKEVFERVGRDKMDDGIIQQNRFGIKRHGFLTPEYLIPSTGRSITSW
nr:DUF6384 family protein [Arenicellales bacterium]